jgi:hypothetical protein
MVHPVAARSRRWSASYISDFTFVYDTRVLSTAFPSTWMRKSRMLMSVWIQPTSKAGLDRSAIAQAFGTWSGPAFEDSGRSALFTLVV